MRQEFYWAIGVACALMITLTLLPIYMIICVFAFCKQTVRKVRAK